MTHRLWPLVVAALAAPGALSAQAPAPAPPPPAAPLIKTQIDLGFVSTAGNASVRTLNVGEQLIVQPAPWKFTQTFSIVNGYTSGVETVNTLAAGLQVDYALGPRFRVYALGGFSRNRFAGIARRFEEAAGLAYGVLTGPANVLDVEAGAGRVQQTGVTGPSHQFWVSRLAVHYKLNFTSHAFFEQKAEALADLADFRNVLVNGESALVAPIATGVALKVGYLVRFANQPQPGFKKADTILSAGLQLQF